MRVFKSIVKAASFLVVCLVCLTFVSATSGEPMDIVVLFDMSRGGPDGSFDALTSFEETRDYISGAFLKEFLRKGDTFHLISFGETPRIELSRRIEGEGDYRTIIGRLLLLYPLARSSSLENAAAYAERFVAELPPARQKKVVFFTPQSDAQGGITAAELGARFNRENTDVYMASTPASFGTLAGGRAMREAPPEPAATMAVTTRPSVQPSLPIDLAELVKSIPPVTEALPASPPVVIPPVSERVEPALPSNVKPPVIKIVPGIPPDITAAPANPESRRVWDGYDEPILFDKIKAMTTILSLAGMILLSALALGCAVTWKKRDRADVYTIEDLLSQINKNAAPENVESRAHYVPPQGLLQKADGVREQLA